jgi:hypothetical protein
MLANLSRSHSAGENGLMKRSSRIAGLLGLIALAAALPMAVAGADTAHKSKQAGHASAQPKAPPPPKPVGSVKVTVTNSRPANLVELRAGVSGSGKMSRVLGMLKPGKEAVARLPRGEACQVDLHGAFDDGQSIDSTGVDVCVDKTVNLTD